MKLMIKVGNRVDLKPNSRGETEKGIVWFVDPDGTITVIVFPSYRYNGDKGYRYMKEAEIVKVHA
jgi:hypothetical protein